MNNKVNNFNEIKMAGIYTFNFYLNYRMVTGNRLFIQRGWILTQLLFKVVFINYQSSFNTAKVEK